ncbi:hypothetical protein U0035_15235 [Niabella yanshanensis]|uniref:Lipocalin-like domain-containing protein n=1 Tax=Niabella yanshanensis TaxID=577386 RepID=A0ABZ0W188_9BACT|nr:hypothetical protein [Niabella yanshanensis]WQD37025.1 hypothetical protein U0035_15235 [Niabella yanshanensis]
MKKTFIIIAAVFAALACLSFTIKAYHDPETVILGSWKEVHWEYDRVYHSAHIDRAISSDAREVKEMSATDLGIIDAESWVFNPDGSLILSSHHIKKQASWKIKGRGNILMITYDNNRVERYNIARLTKGKLELNFDTDANIRGIAKVSCVKI